MHKLCKGCGQTVTAREIVKRYKIGEKIVKLPDKKLTEVRYPRGRRAEYTIMVPQEKVVELFSVDISYDWSHECKPKTKTKHSYSNPYLARI